MEEMDIREDGNPFTKHIILIGNPGVGKSTILNGLVNQVKFKNGFSAGKGMTQCLQLYEHTDGITYGDTPGLSDVKMRKIAAEEITKALQKNGEYKIIFVVTVEAGRVRPDDVTTINLVLDSVKTKVQYAIIINKVSKRFIQDVKTKDDVYETFFSGFNSGNQKTNHLHYFERKEELDDLDDQIPQLPQEVIDFIYKEVPYTLILKQDVQKIQLDQFEKMKEVFETQIDEIKKDARKREEVFEKTIEGLENKRNEIQKQYQEQLEKFQIEQRQLYERMEEERKENHKALLEQQNRYNEEIQKANNENRKQIEEQNKRFQEEMEKKEKNRIEAEKKMKEEIEYLKNRPPPPPVSNGKRGFCCIF